jgi:hypothetical protein
MNINVKYGLTEVLKIELQNRTRNSAMPISADPKDVSRKTMLVK